MATTAKTTTNSAEQYPMKSKDGRPWIATSRVEVMELLASGYTLDNPKDLDVQAPPAESAGKKGEPANAPSKNTPNSTN